MKRTAKRLAPIKPRTRNGQRSLGELLQELVDRVSHRRGSTLRLMDGASVTLQQILLLSRLHQTTGPCTVSDLADQLHLSRPAASQAIARLARMGLIVHTVSASDGRRKQLVTTQKARLLLAQVTKARSNEYNFALSRLPAGTRKDLATVLREVLRTLP
jgi:DNA-binding MarR family transcriptional regulator